jgi:hypothetical protein
MRVRAWPRCGRGQAALALLAGLVALAAAGEAALPVVAVVGGFDIL